MTRPMPKSTPSPSLRRRRGRRGGRARQGRPRRERLAAEARDERPRERGDRGDHRHPRGHPPAPRLPFRRGLGRRHLRLGLPGSPLRDEGGRRGDGPRPRAPARRAPPRPRQGQPRERRAARRSSRAEEEGRGRAVRQGRPLRLAHAGPASRSASTFPPTPAPSLRAADLLAPLAYGQRVLVKAAPRAGRTTLLRDLAQALSTASTVSS